MENRTLPAIHLICAFTWLPRQHLKVPTGQNIFFDFLNRDLGEL